MSEHKVGRRRRSSSLLYQEPPETIEHMSDQAALPNLNANWVKCKRSVNTGSSRNSKYPVGLRDKLKLLSPINWEDDVD
jgi:hypothetical protein